MPSDTRDFQTLQLKALTIHYFSTCFATLEKTVKDIFKTRVREISADNKSLLYFYLAGIKHSARIEYSSGTLITDSLSFSSDENFSGFSFAQIVKMQRQNRLLSVFDFTIPSINNKTVVYDFSDCCEKLISTRNKLAHERSSIVFTPKEIIEVLPDSQIMLRSADWFSSLDTTLMDDETKAVFSNLIIMELILKLLKERGGYNELKTVDIK